jgi:hypothetical protein
MRIKTTSDLFRIPVSSLRDHVYGVTLGRKRGGQSILSQEEERHVVDWILKLQDLGHPISLTALRMKVAEMCQSRETPFTDGIRGGAGSVGGKGGTQSFHFVWHRVLRPAEHVACVRRMLSHFMPICNNCIL